MADANHGISKEGAVGKNMAGALGGHTQGTISSNYKGMPRNANPHYPHNPANSQPVAEEMSVWAIIVKHIRVW
ncbi:unnamed protein product, partial [Rotaria sp. Silwood1]